MDESLLIVLLNLNETYISVCSQHRVKIKLTSVHVSKIKWDIHKRWMDFMWTDRQNQRNSCKNPLKERYSLKWWQVNNCSEKLWTTCGCSRDFLNSLWSPPLSWISPFLKSEYLGGVRYYQNNFGHWEKNLSLPKEKNHIYLSYIR